MEATHTRQQAQHLPRLPGAPLTGLGHATVSVPPRHHRQTGDLQSRPNGVSVAARGSGARPIEHGLPLASASCQRCVHIPRALHTHSLQPNPQAREEPERPFAPGSASTDMRSLRVCPDTPETGHPGHCDPRQSLSCAQKRASLAKCWHLPSRDAAQLPGAYMSPTGATAQAPASGRGGCGQQRFRACLTAHRPAGTCRSRKVPAGPAAVSTRSSARP